MSTAPPPLEWHPYYASHTYLIDWLNEVGDFARHPEIRLPKIRSKNTYVYENEITTDIGWSEIVLHRVRCWGRAPYVGAPFIYVWNAAIDDYGRAIAGESTIHYLPPRLDQP